MRNDLFTACSRDILFFVNTFVWTYDPRRVDEGLTPKVPFITYPYQDEAFLKFEENGGRRDTLIEKSRDMGASWICLTWMFYRWLTCRLQSFLMVSRKELLVDGSKDSLFHHMDFIRKGLPQWMIPAHKRNRLKLENLHNGSVIEGESTTDNIGRGGRRTAMLIDEFAAFENGGYEVLSATADNTNCRIFNSTPAGTQNAFYAQRQKGTPRLRMHWSLHPEKGAGLYRPNKDGSVEILDHVFWDHYRNPNGTYRDPYNENERFVFKRELPESEEKVRSPWYDRECARRAHKVEIATQLDIDYQGSAYPYFDPETIEYLIEQYCSQPLYRGYLDFTRETIEPSLVEDQHGILKVWPRLNTDGWPKSDRDYIVSVDVSQGTGASDSTATVTDRLGGEKVAEMASNNLSESHWAKLCVALCKFFRSQNGRPAFLIWEATGPGRGFGRAVVDDLGFSNYYLFQETTTLQKKIQQKPGWFSTRETKRELLSLYRDQLFSKSFLNPSETAMRECLEYIYLPTGAIEHGGSANSPDPSEKGDNHGDRVIADALGAKILKERGPERREKQKHHTPVMSFAWRRQQRRRHQEKSGEESAILV